MDVLTILSEAVNRGASDILMAEMTIFLFLWNTYLGLGSIHINKEALWRRQAIKVQPLPIIPLLQHRNRTFCGIYTTYHWCGKYHWPYYRCVPWTAAANKSTAVYGA